MGWAAFSRLYQIKKSVTKCWAQKIITLIRDIFLSLSGQVEPKKISIQFGSRKIKIYFKLVQFFRLI